MKTKRQLRLEILNEALTERGCVPIHAIDTMLVENLCDIIGILHRMLEAKGVDSKLIQEHFSKYE